MVVTPPPADSAEAEGRGVALWKGGRWKVLKSVARPGEDVAFEDATLSAPSEMVLAHRRQKTIGRVRIANTQPFHRDKWAFAHLGTIEDLERVRHRVSAQRARELEGDTDSELLFAYVLGALDVAAGAAEAKDAALVCAMLELLENAPMGGYSFVLSNADTLYAFQKGHPLYVLERGTGDRTVPSGTAVLVASAPLTDEQWRPLANGELVRVHRDGTLTVRTVLGGRSAPITPSGPELPFTD
jgi:glutamine amidotransferase